MLFPECFMSFFSFLCVYMFLQCPALVAYSRCLTFMLFLQFQCFHCSLSILWVLPPILWCPQFCVVPRNKFGGTLETFSRRFAPDFMPPTSNPRRHSAPMPHGGRGDPSRPHLPQQGGGGQAPQTRIQIITNTNRRQCHWSALLCSWHVNVAHTRRIY